MALSRQEKALVATLLVLVGLVSFFAGRVSVVISDLQKEKPIAIVGEQPRDRELEKLFNLSGVAAPK